MKQFLLTFFGSAGARLLNGITMLVCIHYLTGTELASLTITISVVSAVSSMVTTPLNHIYILSDFNSRAPGSVGGFLKLQLSIAGGICVIAFPMGFVVGALVPLSAVWLVALIALEFSRSYRQARMEFGLYGLYELSRTGTILAALLLVIYMIPSVPTATMVIGINAIITIIVSTFAVWPIFKKNIVSTKTIPLPSFRSMVKNPYFTMVCYFVIISLFSQIDVLILSIIASPEVTATYGSALRYYQLLLIALGATHVILLPAIKQAHDSTAVGRIFAEYRKTAYLISAVIALSVVFAHIFIPIVDGGKYPDAINTFRILAFSAGISMLCSPYVSVLLSKQDFKFLLAVAAAALVFDVILLVPLIANWSSIGAAIATLVGTSFVTVPIAVRAQTYLGRIRSH
jgi:O-antigen/teichoic acid export membrane protein